MTPPAPARRRRWDPGDRHLTKNGERAMNDPDLDLSNDIRLGRQGDAEARAREIANARENWPGATWGPFDDPPVGVRVRLPVSLSLGRDGDVVTVVGLFQNDPSAWPRPHDCPSCTCKRVAPPCVGWWAVRRDGEENAIPVYPPCLAPVHDTSDP